MMQLICNGVRLDLPSGSGLQFTHDNPLFSFDKLSCERTTQFKLPRTETNDRVFALARVPAYDGVGMRRRFAAELQDGAVVKSGYLYVSSFDGSNYAAIFVCGELVGLQALKDAGRLSDIITSTLTATWGYLPYIPSAAKSSAYAQISYKSSREKPLPSARLESIIDEVLQTLGVSWTAPALTEFVRYIPDEPKGIKSQTDTFDGAATPMPYDGTYPIVYNCTLDDLMYMMSYSDAKIRRIIQGGVKTWTGKVRQLMAKQPIRITFPDDWDDDIFVGYFIDGDSQLIGEFSFYGDRSFDEFRNVTGDSLRGRSVDIPLNGYFCFLDINSYRNDDTSEGHEVGWAPQNLTDVAFTIQGGGMEVGSLLRYVDNLPDITITELLKVVAALNGLQLNYTDADGVIFEALNFNTWAVVDMTNKLTKRNTVTRTFADYVQHNLVQFDSADEVQADQRKIVDYTIDNDNLETEKELQTIPFTEGESAGLYNDREIIFSDNSALADADTTATDMLRVLLPKNTGLQTLCDASTQIQVEARLSLMEYNAITAKTIIQVEGTQYVWTTRSWQKDIAKFTLAKI